MTRNEAMAVLTNDLFGRMYAEELLSHARWSDDGTYVLVRSDTGRITITVDNATDEYTITREAAR